jgi:hypothetical protein
MGGGVGKHEAVSAAVAAAAQNAAEKAAEAAAADLDTALNKAARRFDVQLCRELIESGASAKRVFRKGENIWYDGDSATCLWNAILSWSKAAEAQGEDATAQERFVDTLVLLLEAGADVNFEAKEGGWNRVSHNSLFERATRAIVALKEPGLRKRAFLAFVAAGVDVNRCEWKSKQGESGGYGDQSYPIFKVVRRRDRELLTLYLEAGVDPNCAKSRWGIQFADLDDGSDEVNVKVHTPLLHAAVIDGSVHLARLLISKGADANQNMCFMVEDDPEAGHEPPYLISCLQLATEQGDAEMVDMLTSAGAQMEVTAPLTDTVRGFTRKRLWLYPNAVPRPYEAGRWTAKQAKNKEEEQQRKGRGAIKKKKGKKKR